MCYSRERAGDKAMPQVQICRGFGDKDWEELANRLDKGGTTEDWRRAVDVFERRIRERFLSCISRLEEISLPEYVEIPDTPNSNRKLPPEDSTMPGFAIVALCCSLVETLQLFRSEGAQTNQSFKAFLTDFLDFSPEQAKHFCAGIRNGIIHEAETRGWVIRRDEPKDKVVGGVAPPYVLNRTVFCRKLVNMFEGYLDQLRNPAETNLRERFVHRMSRITEKCRKV